MSEENTDALRCPGNQALSELVDGENELPNVSRHVSDCVRCKDVVGVYRKIDRATRHDMTPPEDLADRIKQACREVAPVKKPLVLWWTSPSLRVAAGLLITAMLAALAMNVARDSKEFALAAKEPERMGAVIARNPNPAPAAAFPANDRTVVQGDEMRVVNAQGGAATGNTYASIQRQVVLPAEVKHVWTVEDLESAEKYFLSALPASSRPTVRQLGPARTGLTVFLRDQQLQALVEGLAAKRWDLVASALPQPRKRNEVRFVGRPVLYDVQLVEKRRVRE